jgi:hypothetical protein
MHWTSKIARYAIALSIGAMALSTAGGQSPSQPAAADAHSYWWQHAVIYEIYPRSF